MTMENGDEDQGDLVLVPPLVMVIVIDLHSALCVPE
jgi:hypothetical protein